MTLIITKAIDRDGSDVYRENYIGWDQLTGKVAEVCQQGQWLRVSGMLYFKTVLFQT